MITLYGFGRIFREGIGETKDLRVEWALQETGLPYRVHALDHTAGELDSPAYRKISPFRQAPAIDDNGFVVAESGAALLYIAEKAGKLIPSDVEGRTRVTQWCFAAVSTVAPTLSLLGLGDIAGLNDNGRKTWTGIAKRWLDGLEERLDGREWIACQDFTVADILLATVLREVRNTDLVEPYPRLKAYYARALARPAWERTLALYAERFGVSVADIR
ncbi:MAG: glutathione S-transferase family protein [Xanthobacteraceae bacterium]|uniref:glutathione S-transferase family protein n=1 Tax=Pseudolabrys sp. TaxID=1960880 RepID=UPI003D0D794E